MDSSANPLNLARLAVCFTILLQGVCGQLTVSSNVNLTAFPGGRFDRICSYPHNVNATLEWLRDQTVVMTSSPGDVSLHYLNGDVGFSDEGQYSCRARRNGGVIGGPENAGYLRVLDPDRIHAPPLQYAILYQSTTLNCTTDFSNTHITWLRRGQSNSIQPTISNVTLGDEGGYVCRVHLSDEGLSFERDVELKVIVPPMITSRPLSYYNITGNPTFNLTVEFKSRFQENTTVTWYRDSNALPEGRAQTTYIGEMHGMTVLNFTAISRSDAGIYQVTVRNILEVIPTGLMTSMAVSQLKIIVLPAIPANLIVNNITSSQAQITWSLTNQHVDEEAENLTLSLEFNNGTLAEQYSLAGDVTQQRVTTIPGMEYRVTLTASNQDGTGTADPVSFQTPAGEPGISSVEVTRISRTTFNLSVNLAYTGGGVITHFNVSFRSMGTAVLTALGQVPATPSPDSSLEWTVVVSSDEFAALSQVEFWVSVANEQGFASATRQAGIDLVLPGAPTPSLLFSTTSSLTIEVQLSSEGTPPILEVQLQITSPQGQWTVNKTGTFVASEMVQLEVTGLPAGTEYTVVAYTVNYAGMGPASDGVTYRTDGAAAGFPMWAIIAIAVGGSVAVTVVVFIAAVICCCCYRHNSDGDKYYAGSQDNSLADEKRLDPSHEMVNRYRQTNGLPSGSSDSGHLSPRSPCTTASSLPLDSPFFKNRFESVSNDSEGSEVSYPRYPAYTCRVSPIPAESVHSLPTTRGNSLSRELLSPPPTTPSYATDV